MDFHNCQFHEKIVATDEYREIKLVFAQIPSGKWFISNWYFVIYQ